MLEMEPSGFALTEWVQGATAAELAAFMGLAGARLVVLLGGDARRAEDDKEPRLVSVEKASKLTGMSRRWFYDRPAAPFVRRLGRSFRIDLAALKASLEQRRG